MDIKQLTEEMQNLVRSKGWYETDSKRPQTPRNLAISLAVEAAEILDVDPQQFNRLLSQASSEISRQVATDILIIEDEPLIAMDIEQMVESCPGSSRSRSGSTPPWYA